MLPEDESGRHLFLPGDESSSDDDEQSSGKHVILPTLSWIRDLEQSSPRAPRTKKIISCWKKTYNLINFTDSILLTALMSTYQRVNDPIKNWDFEQRSHNVPKRKKIKPIVLYCEYLPNILNLLNQGFILEESKGVIRIWNKYMKVHIM